MKYNADIWIGGKYIGKGNIKMFFNYAPTPRVPDGEELNVMFIGGPIAGKSMKLRTPLESLIQVPYISEKEILVENYDSFVVGNPPLANQCWNSAFYRLKDCTRTGSVVYEWEHTVAMEKLPEKYQRLITRQ
jgi:hypothetical protein